MRSVRTLVLIAAALAPALAAAQTPPAAKSPAAPQKEIRDPDCTPSRATTGDVAADNPKGKDLSDRLAQSNGVICPPPDVDPDMKKPTPQGGPMPVIPPPGGDQKARPK